MPNDTDAALVKAIDRASHELTTSVADYSLLLNRVGDSPYVLLGDASHGTHEFYRERAQITKRLIEEKGFNVVAIEGDWPDACRVNSYVRRASADVDARDALSDFKHFPAWMWRNFAVVEFIEWLRAYNSALPPNVPQTGFYGLDLYSLHASMQAVLDYLDKDYPELAPFARRQYACFEQFGPDPQVYGFIAGSDVDRSCQEGAVQVLVEMHRHASELTRREAREAHDEVFSAEQNARVVANAEAYYRSMFTREVPTWNLRDGHMFETLEALAAHVQRQQHRAKIVVWAHNSHVGDARATAKNGRGQLNIGRLVREKYGRDALLAGFMTHHGTVTAASDWGGAAERKIVRPGIAGSYEALFHEAGSLRFQLIFHAGDPATEGLRVPRLERAIGVIYRPEIEQASDYFAARLSDRFDAVLHFDETRAVEPLETTTEWERGEVPETYPFSV
jgi:erythromycin esterase-like protein